jgi:hypothetical protein
VATEPQSDRARATTLVAVAPEHAFELFTEQVDAWWKRGPRYRFRAGRDGTMRFEPGVGGRLVEVYDESAGDVYEVGRVRIWKPPERLVFDWRGNTFAPGERTEVEVWFEPVPGGTRVTIEHRGWDALPEDHPTRHGLRGEAFVSMIGLWWAELLVAIRTRARSHADERAGHARC